MSYNPCENTKTTYKGNGSQRDFSFAFTYTDEPDVIVMMYEDLKQTWVEQTNKYVFAGPTIIRFITAPPRPTNAEGYNIIITRRTNVSKMEATFYPGSSIRAQDLNDNFEQLRASAEDGRCELSTAINDLQYDVWSKKSVSLRSNYTEEEPPFDTTYREDQEKGYWPGEGDLKSIPTTGAISARLDPYVQDQLPARPPEDGSENPGKLWINTRDNWNSYWDPNASAWVAYVNTGPRGKDGLDGAKGEIGDTAYINIAGRIGPGNWEDIKPNEDITGELYLVDAPINGFPGGGVPKDNEAIGWNGTQWYNYGYTGAEGEKGETGTTDVGTTTTGSPGSDASVVNSGTSQTAVLDFTIPRGDKGEKGDKGDQGEQGDKGDTGSKGETGEYGGIYLKGSVATKGDLPSGGRTNDAYLVTDEAQYYSLADDGTWLPVEATAAAGDLESVLSEGNVASRGATFGGDVNAPKFIGDGSGLTGLNIPVIQDGTTSQKGIVQLSTSTGSTSSTLAATAGAVKVAYDRGTSGLSAAGTAQSRADKGVADAATAQARADLGVSNAATAQARADKGVSDASAAQSAASSAQGTANAALPKSGGTITGNLTVNGYLVGDVRIDSLPTLP